MADCASKIRYDNRYKILPFKSHSDNSRLKFSRKRIDFEISEGDIYPGEGHRCLIDYDGNQSTLTLVGGARSGEDASWGSSKLSQIKIMSTDDDIYIKSINAIKTCGAYLPAFSKPGFTWGLSKNEMCLWGGHDLNTFKPTNDLYYIKGDVKRGKNLLEIKLFLVHHVLNLSCLTTLKHSLKFLVKQGHLQPEQVTH
jgi:hypothetical protein